MRVDRLNTIEEYILFNGNVSIEELSDHFNMSVSTIRRDLSEILQRGKVKKVYGGVSAIAEDAFAPLSERAKINTNAKKKIGMLAAKLVDENSTIFLDSGSTVPCILPHISCKQSVTIVSHSLAALTEASHYEFANIVCLGGIYNQKTQSFYDMDSFSDISRLRLNKVFIAATGVSLEKGLSNSTYMEAEIKRYACDQGDKVILMADSTKFKTSAMISFFKFENLYAVVTDKRPPKECMEIIESNGILLLCPENI